MATKSMEATSSCIPSFAQTLKLAESLPAYSCENGAFFSEHDIDSTGAKSSTLFLTQVSDMSQCTRYVQSEFDSISKALAALAFPLDPGKLSVLRSKWDGLDRAIEELKNGTENRSIEMELDSLISDFNSFDVDWANFSALLSKRSIDLECTVAELRLHVDQCVYLVLLMSQ
ncbi:uncharacterized protein FOMMEDRAFT_159938 [Fomitiporia mediterranea MF3/22]|uniref:uncharacterized protein n=1 Tax=Fomitiporia mediterranea (strain MF3/22) TaxID=694068 RepID=UPI00044074A6|nr:uncharacterized protein FOMMEDRAFT_159938 [Fomitiporia mediterranea MF3/22]EJD00251.1 hypothetical protein FOMMEDRAFT_159938 [Fomitiporia mediterranea MF3/22]